MRLVMALNMWIGLKTTGKDTTGFILVDEDLRTSVNLLHERQQDVINEIILLPYSSCFRYGEMLTSHNACP
jgi:hypothetical protein